jgi:hypothetical protein
MEEQLIMLNVWFHRMFGFAPSPASPHKGASVGTTASGGRPNKLLKEKFGRVGSGKIRGMIGRGMG